MQNRLPSAILIAMSAKHSRGSATDRWRRSGQETNAVTDGVQSAPAVAAPLRTTEARGSSTGSRIITWMLGRGAPTYAVMALGLSLVKSGAGLYPSWNVYLAFAQNWHSPHASRCSKHWLITASPILSPPSWRPGCT